MKSKNVLFYKVIMTSYISALVFVMLTGVSGLFVSHLPQPLKVFLESGPACFINLIVLAVLCSTAAMLAGRLIIPMIRIKEALEEKQLVPRSLLKNGSNLARALSVIVNASILSDKALNEAQSQSMTGHCFYDVEQRSFYDYSVQLTEIFETEDLQNSKYMEVENLLNMMLPQNSNPESGANENRSRIIDFDFEIEIGCRIKNLHARMKPIAWSGAGTPSILFVTLQDITDRIKTEKELKKAGFELAEKEEQLQRAEHMAALGRISAGVAHEINNPVSFIRNNLDALDSYTAVFGELAVLASRTMPEKYKDFSEKTDLEFILHDISSLVGESIDGCDRITEIVRNLKTFAHPDQVKTTRADINECIESTLSIVNNEIKYKSRLETELAPLPAIECSPGEINQVLLNILVNAAHAIEKDGLIRVSSGLTPDKSGVVIRISDNGSGIAPEHLNKLFDPFFTTKQPGLGTGLGLSISLGIIKKHGGTITVESEQGKGTEFIITLPAAREMIE